MRPPAKLLADLVPLAAIAALAVLLAWPRAPAQLPATPEVAQSESPPQTGTEPAGRPAPASPAVIARLFGEKAPTSARPAPAAPAAPQPTPVDWLKPIGYVVGAGGELSYVFKDTRTGTVLSLRLNGESKGWKLLEVGSSGFILQYEGKRYFVREGS